MKALVKTQRGAGHLELKDVKEPTPKEGQVKILVKAAGICGSDLHILYDRTKVNMRVPVIVGHEYSGIVVQVGEGVEELKIGDHVVSESTFSVCGECLLCRSGNYNLCENRHNIGFWENGAFAEYCLSNVLYTHKIPENLTFEEAALLEPLACCVNGVDYITGISSGEIIMVIGPGTLGLLTLQLAKTNGCRIIVCGTNEDIKRLEIAKMLGADKIVNVNEENAKEEIFKFTRERGSDAIFECSGSSSGVSLALNTVRRGGKVTQFGLSGKNIDIPYELIAYKQIKVLGVFGSTWVHWERAIDYLSTGKINVKPMITNILNLNEWCKGYQLIEQKKAIKVILETTS